MPLIATRGAASAQGFGEFGAVAGPAAYIEDVFSTYLYTGTGSTQTITNGIDLSGKGGLVWIKGRSGATGHRLTDTARGATKSIESNSAAAEVTESTGLTAFGSTGFTIGADADYNTNAATYVSWTFREQAKFFDIVTYTGNGSNRTIAHNLGSVPGCIIVKRTDTAADWQVYHRSLDNTEYLVLNSYAAKVTGATRWNSTTPTSTVFSLGTDTPVNANGGTYVAYLFAHDAGGFGASGADNVISCGSYTGTGSNQQITLGWEPQWVLIKSTTYAYGNWTLMDTMRGWTNQNIDTRLVPNGSDAEGNIIAGQPNATGFIMGGSDADTNQSGQTYIYIAIRRGPMKVPTSGTSVFSPNTTNGGSAYTTNFPIDMTINANMAVVAAKKIWDRLRGSSTTSSVKVDTTNTAAEGSYTSGLGYQSNTGITGDTFNNAGFSNIYWNFRRAPGFFDVVAYTGTSVARTVNHNLAAVPEMMIVKRRDAVGDWRVYDAATGNTKYQVLNTGDSAATSSTAWNNTTPTSSVFSLGTSSDVNASGSTYVAYLFATCPGVSKVGSYTGTGTTKQIDCGFTGGARFVLIKRTDSTGDWYVWDSARGIVAGNDPYLLLNSAAAEVTNTDYVDTYSAGFEISSTAPAAINANGGTFIFLAIA